MHEVTFYCACGDPDCPLQMRVVWMKDVIFVHTVDKHDHEDRQHFSYTEFVTMLEEMYAHPSPDDKCDFYTYQLNTPLRYSIDTFLLHDRNYNYLLQYTKDVISANATF